MIKTYSLTLKRDEKIVIQNFDFTWNKGEKVVLVGPTGGGKTTLALGLSGIIQCEPGNIVIDSMDIVDFDLSSLRKKIGIIFQDPETQFVTTDVGREIGFGLSNINKERSEIKDRIAAVVEDFNLKHILNRDPSSLSAGEKQMVAIASVYAMQPEYLIFDEVTSFLDRKSRERIYELWEDTGSSILIITQNFQEINFGERVILLEDGKINFDAKTGDLEGSSHFAYDSAFFNLLRKNKDDIPQYERILELLK
ncbi:ABC transporter ATP-binding protein [candidate division WOR-3 bacterium]|nr:ABC transporter ATP-binding protein [candidate division WOR-3 bacterium]